MTSYTPNLDLAKQDTGAQNWGTVLNENFDKIDAGVAGKENKITADNAGDNIFIETEKEITTTGEGSLEISLKNSSDVSYVKALGKCAQASTPTASSPVDILCNNGVIKVKDDELPLGYKRLLDISTTGNVRYISNVYLTGNDTLKFRFKASPGNLIGAYNDADANDNFSFYNSTNSGASYTRYNGQTGGSSTYTSTEYTAIISPTGVTGIRNPSSFTPTEFTCSIPLCVFATSPTGSAHGNATIYGSVEVTGSQNLKLIPCERVSDGAIGYYETYNGEFLESQGSGTPTTSGYDTSHFQVYCNGTVETVSVNNTSATCQPLLSVGDYKDVQNITVGVVTRNVGVLLLTGDESWTVDSASGVLYGDIFTGKSSVVGSELCSHYSYDDSSIENMGDNTFKVGSTTYPRRFYVKDSVNGTSEGNYNAWLKAQLEAGTPVMILYPLASGSTESVSEQELGFSAGNNEISTSGSLTNLGIEIHYTAEFLTLSAAGLPSQTSHAGEFLKTDGTEEFWSALPTLTSSDVTTALGYTPYNSSNPSGYTSNVGTVTSVNNTSPDSGGNVTLTLPDPLPSQTGQNGKFLYSDGADASWVRGILASELVDVYAVTDYYRSGNNWYICISTGTDANFVIQGGRTPDNSNNATVTFAKAMANTNYGVVLGSIRWSGTDTGGVDYAPMAQSLSVTGMKISQASEANRGTCWAVFGLGATE